MKKHVDHDKAIKFLKEFQPLEKTRINCHTVIVDDFEKFRESYLTLLETTKCEKVYHSAFDLIRQLKNNNR